MNSGKHPWLAGVLAGSLIILFPITGAWGATPLSNLVLRPQDGFTELLVPGAGRLLCNYATQEAADGHPFRIVLDFCDADHALGGQNFDALPATVVSRIRTSQYTQTPQKIVRVVLDLRKSASYTVNAGQNTVTVRIVDRDRATFAVWEANPGDRPTLASKTDAVTAPASAASTPTAQAGPKQAFAKTESKTTAPSQTKMVASQTSKPDTPNKPVTTVAAAPPSTSENAKKAVSTSTPVAPAPASGVSSPAQPSVQPAAKTVTDNVKKAGTPPTRRGGSFAEQGEPVTTSKQPVTTPGSAAETSPATTSFMPPATVATGETPRIDTYVTPKRPLVLAPEYLYGDDPAIQNPSTEQDDVPVAQVSMEPLGPKTPVTPQSGAATASTTETGSSMLASTTTLPLMSKTTDARKPGDTTSAGSGAKQGPETLFDRLRDKFFSEQTPPRPYTTVDLSSTEVVSGDGQSAAVYGPPTPAVMLTREELLEKVRQAAQTAGVEPGQFADDGSATSVNNVPSRQMIIYDDMGRRDPFAPLSKGLRSGFVSDQLPSVENLRLVGVLRDDHESLALLENLEGYGYVLHVGDRVENGSVVAIEENRVLFRVQDYGWSHVVALQLTTRGADPSKSLGAKTPAQLEYPDENQTQQPNPKTIETPKTESANP